MSTCHIYFKENQNYYFRKYNNFCSKLLYRRMTHYWANAAGNRWVKIGWDESDKNLDSMLTSIYRCSYYKKNTKAYGNKRK